MTLCPIAIAAGCKKCPAVGFCPLKSVIGDFKPDADASANPQADQGQRSDTQAK